MAKLIIYAKGHPLVNGLKLREYLWMEKYGCYVYLGKELDEHEFNEVIEKAISLYRSFFPLVRIVEFSEPAPAPAKAPPAAELDIDESPPPDMDLSTALDVVERLAPHRLKKQPGPHKVAVSA